MTVAAVAGGCGGPHRTAQPLPASFEPVSLTAIDSRNFSLLGTVPCAAGRCYAIERTVDGGRSFTRTPAPRGLPTKGTTPTLRFANARDGFVWVPFGWGTFYVTHDGGASWRHIASPALVALTTSGGEAYAVLARCRPSGCDRYRFARGPVHATGWTESPLPFIPDGPVVDLAAYGRRVWLLGTTRAPRLRHDTLARSSDGGRTFASGAGPCVPGLGGTLVPSSARVLWAVCPTGMLAGAARSTDGGVTFAALHTPQLANSGRIVPSSDEAAILDPGGAGRPLYRTVDSGATWRLAHLPADAVILSGVVFARPRVVSR